MFRLKPKTATKYCVVFITAKTITEILHIHGFIANSHTEL